VTRYRERHRTHPTNVPVAPEVTLIGNFISGIILRAERRIRVGDIVEIDGERGRVARIGVRSSLIKRTDGVEMLVPNSRFLDRNVVNWTLSDRLAQFAVSLGVAYGSPTTRVAEVIERTVAGDARALKNPATQVLFEEFGERGLVFTVRFWLRLGKDTDHQVVCSDLRHLIDAALTQAGIELARPYGAVELGDLRHRA
jgi:potassium efflux system protein